MAKVLITDSYLTAIAGAIRTKKGTSVTYEPSEMASAISSIESGYPEPTGTVSITQNGTANVKDYASANVNVPNTYSAGDEGKVVRSGTLVSQSSTTKNANGTYDTTLNNQVVVNVANSYSAGDEGKVVDNGALVTQGSQTITQNGTYDTTLISELIVNVEGGSGGGSISINDYVFNYTPTVVASGSMSAGFAFTVSKRIKISKIRVFATESTVSVHLVKDGADIVSILDASVVANQWNDIALQNAVILEPNAAYIVWHSHKTQHPKALGTVPAYRVPFITYLNSVYATTADTFPTRTESGSLIGVDLYVDSILADEGQ